MGPAAGPAFSVLFLPLQQHSNASQSLCDIIRLSREQMIQMQDSPEPDQLLATLEKWVCGSQTQGGRLSGVSSLSPPTTLCPVPRPHPSPHPAPASGRRQLSNS